MPSGLDREESKGMVLVEIQGLKKYFVAEGGLFANPTYIRAVDSVDLRIEENEILGVVGESGSGKTTLGRCILRLIPPTSGRILFGQDADLLKLSGTETKKYRKYMQIVFQDPFSSLNPRKKVLEIIGGPMYLHGESDRKGLKQKVIQLLRDVGLDESSIYRYPHEFSGGQRQRIAIARALAVNPRFIVLDEPTSALDVSVQAQILNLLKKLKEERNLTYLFISHNVNVINFMCGRVAVMYCGKVMEIGPKDAIFNNPRHIYTQRLLQAVLSINPEARRKGVVTKGEVPDPANPPAGCRFNPRCDQALKKCLDEEPPLQFIDEAHQVACHLVNP